MATSEIIEALGLIGIGGIIVKFLDFFVERKKRKFHTKHEFKETRYKAIILLCYSYLNFENEGAKIIKIRPDISTEELLNQELNVEFMNMTLYASDKVIISMKKFIESKNRPHFNNLILTMRRDLYGIKSKLKVEDLE